MPSTHNQVRVLPDYLQQFHRDVAQETVRYSLDYLGVSGVKVEVILTRKYKDCWGECWQQPGDSRYGISICTSQPLRDMIATITHECVHIRQYETGEWEGDGEREAEDLQYTIADELWKDGVL
tara:strand:- start:857 stop:1225 length:369 start_codon:yes stop_codon:yes gene_type:complete